MQTVQVVGVSFAAKPDVKLLAHDAPMGDAAESIGELAARMERFLQLLLQLGSAERGFQLTGIPRERNKYPY